MCELGSLECSVSGKYHPALDIWLWVGLRGLGSHALIEAHSNNVMCDSWQILWENVVGYDPSSSHVEVFMNEEKALWAEWKHSDDFD